MTKPLPPQTLATLAVPFYPVPRVLLALDRQERGCHLTTYQLAEILYPGVPCDSALPQLWVDEWAARDIDVRGHFVWGYPPSPAQHRREPFSPLGGVPLPLVLDTWEWMLSLLPSEPPGVERTALHWLKLRRAKAHNPNPNPNQENNR